jgi:hypothetical protein
VLPSYQWRKLSNRVRSEHNQRCSICGIEPRKMPQDEVRWQLHCHEIFEYDDTEHIQRLARFTALCNFCHDVKHGKEAFWVVASCRRSSQQCTRPGMANWQKSRSLKGYLKRLV